MKPLGKTDHLDFVARQSIDGAAHAAVSRFKDRIADDDVSTVSRVARAAAEIAVEQFKAMCKAELSLIQADYDLRFNEAMLRPAEHFIATDPPLAPQPPSS